MCITTTMHLDLKNCKPRTLALQQAPHSAVRNAIEQAQSNGIENLLLTDINTQSLLSKPTISTVGRKWQKNGIKYLAINNSTRPDLWNFFALNKAAVKTIRIEACDFYSEKTQQSVLTRGLINSIASENLISLTISHSNLNLVEDGAFKPLTGIRFLSLSYNSLEQLSAGCIAINLTRLWNLDLSYNRLKYIDRNLLEMLPALSHLKLNDNRLINIGDYMCFMPTGMPRKEVQLLNNPIVCTSLCWLFRVRKLPNMFKATTCYLGDQTSTPKYAITSVVVRRICRHHALGDEFPSSKAIAGYIWMPRSF